MEKGKINQCCGTVEGTPHIFECEYGALTWQNQEDGQTIGRLTSRITELETNLAAIETKATESIRTNDLDDWLDDLRWIRDLCRTLRVEASSRDKGESIK